MKYLVMIKEDKLGKVSPDMYSDIWVVKDGEDDKYVEAINKFQDDLIEGGATGKNMKKLKRLTVIRVIDKNSKDIDRKAIILHVCPKSYSFKVNKFTNLYKILWFPFNDMDYTWWQDESDIEISKL